MLVESPGTGERNSLLVTFLRVRGLPRRGGRVNGSQTVPKMVNRFLSDREKERRKLVEQAKGWFLGRKKKKGKQKLSTQPSGGNWRWQVLRKKWVAKHQVLEGRRKNENKKGIKRGTWGHELRRG